VLHYIDKNSSEVICSSVVDGSKTITQIMSEVQMKPMDIVLYIDNCSSKKMGKEVTVMPKLQAVNIVLSKSADE
jgi:hypothetical protein